MNRVKQYIRQALCLVLMCVLAGQAVITPHAFAEMVGDDRNAILLDAPLYRPLKPGEACSQSGATSGTVGAAPSELVGNDNVQKTYNFFFAAGLGAKGAAGITGNALAESGINPLSKSGLGYRGIFQWDGKPNGRYAQLTKWTQDKGLAHESLEGQLQFALHEAGGRTNSPPGLKANNLEGVKQQQSVELATWYWGRYFEVAITGGSSHTPLTNVQHLDRRTKFANEVFAKYGGGEASGNQTAAAALTQDCATAPGQNTTFVDGFTVYSQYDPAWKDLPFSTSTIGESGCGPAAMAMAITNLTGQRVTPVETAKYAAEKGQYVPGSGSSWTIVPILSERWNLKYEAVGKDLAKIRAALRKGGVVVTSGKGSLPFTGGGHYIVIRAETADGKFKVGDSGHRDTNTVEYDAEDLIQKTPGGSAYAVYKS